jgi:hypothetical protein
MSRKARPACLIAILNDVLAGISSNDEEKRDISSLGQCGNLEEQSGGADLLALKALVAEMPLTGKESEANVNHINKRVLDLLTQVSITWNLLMLAKPEPTTRVRPPTNAHRHV